MEWGGCRYGNSVFYILSPPPEAKRALNQLLADGQPLGGTSLKYGRVRGIQYCLLIRASFALRIRFPNLSQPIGPRDPVAGEGSFTGLGCLSETDSTLVYSLLTPSRNFNTNFYYFQNTSSYENI